MQTPNNSKECWKNCTSFIWHFRVYLDAFRTHYVFYLPGNKEWNLFETTMQCTCMHITYILYVYPVYHTSWEHQTSLHSSLHICLYKCQCLTSPCHIFTPQSDSKLPDSIANCLPESKAKAISPLVQRCQELPNCMQGCTPQLSMLSINQQVDIKW